LLKYLSLYQIPKPTLFLANKKPFGKKIEMNLHIVENAAMD